MIKLVDTFIPGVAIPKGSTERVGQNVRNVKGVDAWVRTMTSWIRRSLPEHQQGGEFALWPGATYVLAEFVMPTLGVVNEGPGAADLDKLQRGVGDALQYAGVIANDVQIVHWNAWKRTRAKACEQAGVRLEVWALDQW